MTSNECGSDSTTEIQGNKAAVRDKVFLRMETDKMNALNRLNESTKKRNELIEQHQFLQLCMLDPEHETSKLFMADMRRKMAAKLKNSREEESQQQIGEQLMDPNGNPMFSGDGEPVMKV